MRVIIKPFSILRPIALLYCLHLVIYVIEKAMDFTTLEVAQEVLSSQFLLLQVIF